MIAGLEKITGGKMFIEDTCINDRLPKDRHMDGKMRQPLRQEIKRNLTTAADVFFKCGGIIHLELNSEKTHLFNTATGAAIK